MALLAAFASWAAAAQAQRGEGPFAGLSGAWAGAGTVTLSDGSSERIRCRSTYQVGGGGSTLVQSLRCASDSYRFDLNSSVAVNGGALSGTWNETTRGASGGLAGQASPGQIVARASSAGFTADLTVTTRGNRQSVTIRAQNVEFTGVSLSLTKS